MSGSAMLDQAMTLRKVKRIKNILLIVIVVVMVVLIIVSMVHKGLSASPLFLPFPAILFTVLMAGMLMTFVVITFAIVQIVTSDSPGQRFLVAQHSMKVSLITGVIVFILALSFAALIPWVEKEVSTLHHETIDTTLVRTHDFFNVDEFDTTYVDYLTLENVEGAPVLFIIKAKDPDTGTFDDKEMGQVFEGEMYKLDLKEWPRGDYRIEIYIDGTPTQDEAEFEYRLDRYLNPEVSVSLTGFLGAIGIANIIWGVIAFVLMRKYEQDAVGGLAGSFMSADDGLGL